MDKKKRTMDERGYGWEWMKLRKRAWALYGNVCHLCGRPGADTMDHLDPIAIHGPKCPTIDRVRPAHRKCNSARGSALRHGKAAQARGHQAW